MASTPSGQLSDLLPPSSANAVHLPSSDAVVQAISARYRQDHSASWIGDSTLVSLNPNQVLPEDSDASQAEYEARSYLVGAEGAPAVQPHAFDLACRAYLLMRRTGQTQSIVYSGLSGSGKSRQAELVTSQLLRLGSSGKKDTKIAEQVHALDTVLYSFGSAKTQINPSASRFSKWLELHFNHQGKLAGAKVLTFGLDKLRLANLAREERTYHVFYQLLAGATKQERLELNLLDDWTEYDILASSGCYRLPAGPGSDDSIAFDDLRASLKVLGFKPRHISSILRLLSAILVLGNIQFDDNGDDSWNSESAWVSNRDSLGTAAHLLGVDPEALERSLTNRVRWVRKEMCAFLLKADGAQVQRNSLTAGLYAILFAFVVETANHKLFPGDEAIADVHANGGSSIVQLDSPGFHTRTPDRPGSGVLLRALNGFDEFTTNYTNEVTQFWLTEHQFDGDAGVAARAQEDGVRLADVIPPDGSARIELLRGGRVGGKADRKPGGLLGGLDKTCASVRKGASTEEADESLLEGMRSHFGAHTAFVPTPGGPSARSAFGISHFAGTVTYNASSFIEHDLDALDPDFVALFRDSNDGFIAKLFSGPSLAAEVHPLDDNTIVAAQVSSQPLRRATPVVPANGAAPLDPENDLTAPLIDPLEIHPLTTQLNATLSQLLNLAERTKVWSLVALRPNDNGNPRNLDSRRVKAQVSAYLLPELIARKKVDFVADWDFATFGVRNGLPNGDQTSQEDVGDLMRGFGDLAEGVDFALGNTRIWLSYRAFKAIEDRLRQGEPPEHRALKAAITGSTDADSTIQRPQFPHSQSSASMGGYGGYAGESVDDLLLKKEGVESPGSSKAGFGFDRSESYLGGGHTYHDSLSVPAPYIQPSPQQSDVWGSDKDAPAGFGALPRQHNGGKEGVIDQSGVPQQADNLVEEVPVTKARRIWLGFVWGLTWWIPTLCLIKCGRMKRPDVRLAWREKVTLCMLIAFFCGLVIFFILAFGNLLCPNKNHVWDLTEVSYKDSSDDYWVAVRGKVYDLTKFYKTQHSDITGESVTSTVMLEMAGLDMTDYFPIPLTSACPNLVTDDTLSLQYENFTAVDSTAVHTSGSQQTATDTALNSASWYFDTFLPKMDNYHKGPLVWSHKKIKSEADGLDRYWAIVNGSVYDLTDYFYTYDTYQSDSYQFLDTDLANLFQAEAGSDVTKSIENLGLNQTYYDDNMNCIETLFKRGEIDFRDDARCLLGPYLILAFSVLIMASILVKFLAALQLGSRGNPELRDRFVICQVPCYTEGEESLRKTIDSLATLQYDDKRKLIMIICDGMIIGSGNDRPTPRIVLDILGVDQDVDPDPLMFKSIAEGSKQLNYGKVWSGLYEVDGHVVPYIVIAKVGRPSERSRPGNRGKRDSQILSMRFLNRVHFGTEMYPLELEMYHQIKNVIGVDPQLYEFMLVIDADTSVKADSLNRLVSRAIDDTKIIGICGETRLENEEVSWWTMIQVYEYFISHHMAKAFESLFGSVTCLPGCFTMYRIRSADAGKPLLCSSLIIDEYSDPILDTLHKKNLLALGEDRYLTTLILKHFPNYKTKFTADAQCVTVAPDRWTVLLSQRRRWINSTVHNLWELMALEDMCGFCCFGMRFVVLIDLVGTLILPATFVYMIYLIVTVATGQAPLPVISLVMIAAVYGFQVIIFLLKRQWQFIGWLIIYLLAYPVYSFLLPVYSFWRFDDFSWGNTRVVVGEGKNKKVIQAEDETFDDSLIPMTTFANYQAALDREQPLFGDDGKSIRSMGTSVAGFSMATKARPPPASYYGGGSAYGAGSPSRSGSRTGLASMGGMPSYPSFGPGAGSPSMRDPRSSYFAGTQMQMMSPGPASEFGGYPGSAMPYGGSMMGLNQMAGGGFPTAASRASMMSGFPASASMAGGFPPAAPGSAYGGGGMGNRRMSGMTDFTMGNPFMSASVTMPAISSAAAPGDAELQATLRQYLAAQDLMQVTRKSAREALQGLYPNADLAGRKGELNGWIDEILSAGQ